MGNRRTSLFNTRSKKTNSGNLRRNATAAEAVLWTYLQKRKLLGRKFRRQSSVGPYIVDFYCAACRLVIELDGAPHFEMGGADVCTPVTVDLRMPCLGVIRKEKDDVRYNIEFVLE